jgi:hypothetical protein
LVIHLLLNLNLIQKATATPSDQYLTPPATLEFTGLPTLDLISHMYLSNQLPHVDWAAVDEWLSGAPVEAQVRARATCARAWLLHLRVALGKVYQEGYQHIDGNHVLLLSAQEARVAAATHTYIVKCQQRARKLLGKLATPQHDSLEVVIIFAQENTYYQYISNFYEEAGERRGLS